MSDGDVSVNLGWSSRRQQRFCSPPLVVKTRLSASSEEFHFLSTRIIPPLFLFAGFWKRFWANNQRSTVASELIGGFWPSADLSLWKGPLAFSSSAPRGVRISVDFTWLLQNKWGRAFVICAENPSEIDWDLCSVSAFWVSPTRPLRTRRRRRPRVRHESKRFNLVVWIRSESFVWIHWCSVGQGVSNSQSAVR